MKLITHLRNRFIQWRQRRAVEKLKGKLREFVYLDEVSVYSLIASRLGPVAAEYTEKQANSLQGEMGGNIGAAASILNADVDFRAINTTSRESQILRKATVQTTFKDLYEYEKNMLVIKPELENKNPPKIETLEDLFSDIQTLAVNGWAIDPQNIDRGKLFELEVQLEADSIFQVGAMASAILEIMNEDAEIFGVVSTNDLVKVRSVGRIIEKLLSGLVPIRGRSVDYCVVEIWDKEWIVRRSIVDGLTKSDQIPIVRPLFIVGVAEQALFWKDIRRILFSKAHYRVFCRVAQNGVQSSWVPVKLAQVFESVVPDLARQMNFAGIEAMSHISEYAIRGKSGNTEIRDQRRCDALMMYAKSLARHNKITLPKLSLNHIQTLSELHCANMGNQKERREAFAIISDYLVERFNIKQDADFFAECRESSLTDAGLDFLGNPIESITSKEPPSISDTQDRFLDSEFVAIYW